MALQPINLDMLDWNRMVTAIRSRIVPDSQGNWTLHAPVDPGVTLIELFAWLLDQRIYWMNQVPDSLSIATLALLGEFPAPATAAVTVLQLANPARAYFVAAAGTLMQLGSSDPPLIFSLDDDLTILPEKGIGIAVDGIDRTNDLHQCRLISLGSMGAHASRIELTLSLSEILPATPSGFFSLMIELETGDDIFPQWSPNAASAVPVPATITWSYASTSGSAVQTFPAVQVQDGTAGLRRSGIVRLPLPADWQAESPGVDSSISAYKILVDIESTSFTYPPQLRRLKSNVILARHSWKKTRPTISGPWPPLPGNVISLHENANINGPEEFPPIEDTVHVEVKEPDGVTRPWRFTYDFSRSAPADRVFAVDRKRSEIRFGDGITGRLPVTFSNDESDITVSYEAGGGVAGDVGKGSSWEAISADGSTPGPQFSAVNLTSGEGGVESEALAAAYARASASINQKNRAVSRADYANLARTTPGVGIRRAFAAVGFHPDFPCSTVPGAITVFLVPYAPRNSSVDGSDDEVYVPAPRPDQGALQVVLSRLHATKLIGGEVFVAPPVYRKVWLTITVAVDAPLSTSTRRRMIDSLQRFFDPLTGGDDGEGWPFGDSLRPSTLLRVAQAALGNAGDVQSVSVSIDNPKAQGKPCEDVPIRQHELVHLMHVDLDSYQRPVQSGGLR